MRIKNWDTFAFIAIYHVLVVALLPAFISVFSWQAAVAFLLTYCIGGLAITVGYHRLFSHKTYNAQPVFEWITLLASTLSLQWSALAWSYDHRMHHKHVDTDKDPYNINRGFFYAHMGWLFDYKREMDESQVSDLLQNPRVMFQHKHFLALTLVINIGIFLFGCLFMDPLAAFYSTFVLRVFAIHHSTWFINSLAHTWGSKTYAKELTAVDNAIMALLTFGEGYHNYHHAFANDFRNGIRWYHFDPSKWIIWMASKIGLTSNLRTVDKIRLQKILVNKDKKLIFDHLSQELDETATELKRKLEELAHAFDSKASMLTRKYAELKRATAEQKRLIKIEIRRLRQELHATWRAWVETTKMAANMYELAHAH